MMAPITQDIKRNRNNTKGLFLIVLFRIAHALDTISRKFILLKVLFLPYTIMYKILLDYIMGIYIPPSTQIGSGMIIFHGNGIVINAKAIIGENFVIHHGVTIGSKDIEDTASPKIGNNVVVGAYAIILGGINIGDNAQIGAGAVVTKNVPPYAVVAGNPARVIAGSPLRQEE